MMMVDGARTVNNNDTAEYHQRQSPQPPLPPPSTRGPNDNADAAAQQLPTANANVAIDVATDDHRTTTTTTTTTTIDDDDSTDDANATLNEILETNSLSSYLFAELHEKNVSFDAPLSLWDLLFLEATSSDTDPYWSGSLPSSSSAADSSSSSSTAPPFLLAGHAFDLLNSSYRASGSPINGSEAAAAAAAAAIGVHVGHSSSSLAAVTAATTAALGNASLAGAAGLSTPRSPRPYYGDAFYSFQNVYWPIHCVICLVICTLGIFANVTNIVVLTRPNMITAVNTILSAMAFSDLIVNISNIPYLMHELGDFSNQASSSYPWALYILFHAHTTVTAHTISIWLTCVLATWRYFVVCRSQSSNQRNWSVGLAKRTIIAVFLLVPIFCMPNYLSFAIVKEPAPINTTATAATTTTTTNGSATANVTVYRVGFSHLADESQFIKTFHFWIFSCLTKLVPCVLLTFFTTVLIRKLLDARERRLRLTTYGNTSSKGDSETGKTSLPNGGSPKQRPKANSRSETGLVVINGLARDEDDADEDHATKGFKGELKFRHHQPTQPENCRRATQSASNNRLCIDVTSSAQDLSRLGGGRHHQDDYDREMAMVNNNNDNTDASRVQPAQHSGSSCATDAELVVTSCDSVASNGMNDGAVGGGLVMATDNPAGYNSSLQHQQPRMGQLIVESNGTFAVTNSLAISATKAPAAIALASCDTVDPHSPRQIQLIQGLAADTYIGGTTADESPRSASTCGGLELYSGGGVGGGINCSNGKMGETQLLVQSAHLAASQDLPTAGRSHNRSLHGPLPGSGGGHGVANSSFNMMGEGGFRLTEKRCSETIFGSRGRSVGSTALAPIQMVKLQATQRQLSQNETTTRLLIAVMIVFLICESPAGILALLCAILGEDFFMNVYQPCGILTDLLALINSSVNFILYCFMSTQFRITFYRVVLHCPAPNMSV